jgi:hypothetical protein
MAGPRVPAGFSRGARPDREGAGSTTLKKIKRVAAGFRSFTNYRLRYHAISVDFEPSNPLSRPFWLGLGFQPTGYRLRRTIDTAHTVHSARSSAPPTT